MSSHQTKTDRRPVAANIFPLGAFVLLPLLVFVVLTPSNARAEAKAGLGEIDAAIIACTGPSAALARARAMQGDAAVSASHVLPNPNVSLEHNRSLSGPLDHETIVGLGIPLGIGGARFALQDAADAERQALLLEATADRFDIALQVRETFARASLEMARLEVLGEQQRAIEGFITRLAKLAKGGEASPYDVLRLESQQAALTLDLKPRRAELAAEQAWLETLVGAEVAVDANAAARLQQGPSPARGANPDHHPTVLGLRKQAEAHRMRATAAERRWAPDLDVFVGYRMVGGEAAQTGHGVSLGLSFPLTFFDYGQGEARRARADAELSDAQAQVTQRQLEARKRAAQVQLEALGGGDEDQQALVLASRWVSDAGKLYEAGEGSMLDVLEALRARTRAKLAGLALAERRLASHFEWMRATGQLLDPRLEAACGDAKRRTP